MNIKEASELAIRLMVEFNLNFWRLKIGNGRRVLGRCMYGRRLIVLSDSFIKLNEKEKVQRTILHEIAHALTEGHHHDNVWKQKCIEIGGDGKRLSSDANVVNYRYERYCPGCKANFRMAHRKGVYYCGKCFKATGKKIYITYKENKDANLPRMCKEKSIDIR